MQSAGLAGAEATTPNGGQDGATSLATVAVQHTNVVSDNAFVTTHVEPTPSNLEVAEQLQRIQAVAAPPAARQQHPHQPFYVRLQRLAGWLERFIMRQKATSALLFACCTLLLRICGEVGLLGPEALQPATAAFAAGHMFLTLEVDAVLTQASWARARTHFGSKHFKTKILAGALHDNDDDDYETLALRDALRTTVSQQDPDRRALLLSQGYAGIECIYSSHELYNKMFQAMTRALRSGADTADAESVSNFQIMLGHLEMNHNRYSQAGERFEDALQTSTSNAAREMVLSS